MRAPLSVLALLAALLAAAPVHAGVSPFWQALGSSASGNGVSQTPASNAVFDTSLAVDGDGQPVVVYAEFLDGNATQGSIVVKRWNGSAFVTLSSPSTPIGQGYSPQVRVSPAGNIYVAWLQDDVNGNTEIHLRVRAAAGMTFDPLGTSDSAGGVVGTNSSITQPFSLAVGADEHPAIAFLAAAQTTNVDVTSTPAIVQDTFQVYVRQWNGTAWEFLGGDFSGTDGFTGGGASNAVSFDSATLGGVLHSADAPTLTIDTSGAPVVAFAYATQVGDTFVDNTDIYVTRWNGTSWDPVGPAVPAADGEIGEGGAGGVSNSPKSSLNPSLAAAPAGNLALAWEEASPDGTALYVWVRVWNGSAWVELAGSATDSGFTEPFTQNGVPQIAVGPDGRPVVAWNALTEASPAAQIFVLRWNGSDAWEEPALQSASETGISDAALEAFAPALALTPSGGTATPGVPTVAWLDSRDPASAQVFLRRLFDGAAYTLGVTLVGDGAVSSDALGLACAAGACAGDFPAGTLLTLTAAPVPGGAFMGWGGACASRGTNLTCPLTINANTSVTAAFKRYRVSVVVGTAGTYQGTVGTVSGGDINCSFPNTGTCSTDISQGERLVLQATPQPGNRFMNWSGGPCSGRTNATCEMVVTANSSSTALFRGVTGVRVLKAGNSTGTVSGPGIACGLDCDQEMFTGASVTLTPVAPTGATFRGWSSADPERVPECDGKVSGTCVFMVSGANRSVVVTNQSVTATFQLNTQKLTVSTAGAGFVIGSGPIDCATITGSSHTQCIKEYDYGSIVDLTPVPDVDSRLASWTGCTSLNGSVCRVVLKANLSVKATFGVARTLSVSASGNGTGKITANTTPALVCVSNCLVSTLVAGNASVTLTPAVAVGTTFHWLADDSCSTSGSAACTVKMAGNRSATGQFTLNRHSLTITRRTNGTVVSDPLPGGRLDCGTSTSACSSVNDFGTPVLLRATADPGAIFTGWTGVTCVPGGTTNASCAFLLKANTTATPTFRPGTRVTVAKAGNGVGTVSGPGISCGTDCTEIEFDAKLITLTAVPATGSRFLGWGDTCAFRGTNTSCAFVPAGANQTVSATFQLIPYTLTVTPRTNGNVVTVDPLADNIDCGAGGVGKCSATLNYGTLVRLQATPIAGSRFVSWTGCTSVVGTNCSFTLTANRTVAPAYRDVTSVSLTKTGQGTVTSAPAGISCGLPCTSSNFDFTRNTLVKLTPAPATGWDFIGWSGDPTCPGTGPCSFNTSSSIALAVAANFSIQLKTLRVTVVGNGSVTGPGFACDDASTPCAQLFPYGTIETLTPAAAPGFRFTGWSQDCTGAVPTTCKPSMTANHSVTATFKQVFGVTVTRQGNAAPGAITSSPAGINCGLDCAEDYLSGTVVTFSRAAPPAGRTFRWLGDCAFRGSNASCALPINANTSVIADYSLQQLGLTVNVSGPGTVSGLAEGPCSGLNCVSIVNYGVPVLLQAAPSASPQGEFLGWTGCTTASGTNCSVTLTTNRTVASVFRPVVTSLAIQAAIGSGSVPLAKGGKRQYSAIATFSDSSTQDVSGSAAWSSGNMSVVTVIPTTGLVTGVGFGNTSISASYRSPGGSMQSGSTSVAADTLAANGVTVDCSPYGQPGGPLSCLPAARSFEVECSATALFAHGGSADVTEQAVWSSGNAGIAKFFGLSDFGGPIVASFRMFAGNTSIKATVGTVVSLTTNLPGNRWTVQGTPLNVTNVTVMPVSVDTAVVGVPVPLTATATLAAMAGTASNCTAAPPSRDFSLLTSWNTVPDPSPIADVSFFGLVTPLATGSVPVHWAYPGTIFQGDVQITIP